MSNPSLAQAFTRRSFLALGSAAGVALTLGVSACSGGPASSTNVGQGTGGATAGRIDVAIGYNNNSSWDPLNTGSAFSMAAHNHVYEPLWDAEAVTRKPFAALASTLPENPSATEWTVKLRSGAKWHDGKPVTADDVVYSFNRVLSNDKKIITYAFFSAWLDKVSKVDDGTIKIALKYPFSAAVQRFSIVKIMPKHVFEGQNDDFFKQGKNAIGSGPYKVGAHQDGAFTTLEKFADYNGPLKVAASTLQWNVSVDAAARIGLLTSGASGVQIADNIPQDNVEVLKQRNLTVEGVDSMNLLGLAFNTSKKPFNDKRVRQALRMAIDTKKLIAVAIAGQGSPVTGFLHESSPDYQKAATQFDYNPERAKALLKEAGVTTPLQVRLLSTNISWTRVAVNTIKEGWDAIGVQTTLDVVETAQFNSKLAAGDAADVVTFSGNPNQFGADADLNIRWFYSPSTQFMPWNKWGETPEYKALDEQLLAAMREIDPAKRKELTGAAMNTIADQAVIYPVMHMKLFTAWDPKQLEGAKALDIPGVNLLNARRKA